MSASDQDAARELACLVTIGGIAGKLAHEINNPLAGIQNAFQLVKGAIPPSHPHYNYVAAIEREIQRIATVTRRLSGNFRPDHDSAVGVAVSAIVSDAVRMAAEGAGGDAGRVRLENSVNESFGAPAGLLLHALHQILESAMRFSPPGEPIDVAISTAGDRLCVELRYRRTDAASDDRTQEHPRRLVTAMGGAMRARRADDGREQVSVNVPLSAPVPVPA